MLSYQDIFSSKKTVLVVTAHPDDVDVFFSGLITKLREGKIECFFQVLTSGDMGEDKVKSGELAKTREQEQLNALNLVGIPEDHVEFTHLKDGVLESDLKTIGEISRTIRRWQPTIVCTFDPRSLIIDSKYIMHRDHRNCGQAAIDAVYPYAGSTHFVPEYGPPFKVSEVLLCDPLKANTEVDITTILETKKHMLSCHKSQWTQEDVEKIIDGNKRKHGFTERFNYFKLEE